MSSTSIIKLPREILTHILNIAVEKESYADSFRSFQGIADARLVCKSFNDNAEQAFDRYILKECVYDLRSKQSMDRLHELALHRKYATKVTELRFMSLVLPKTFPGGIARKSGKGWIVYTHLKKHLSSKALQDLLNAQENEKMWYAEAFDTRISPEASHHQIIAAVRNDNNRIIEHLATVFKKFSNLRSIEFDGHDLSDLKKDNFFGYHGRYKRIFREIMDKGLLEPLREYLHQPMARYKQLRGRWIGLDILLRSLVRAKIEVKKLVIPVPVALPHHFASFTNRASFVTVFKTVEVLVLRGESIMCCREYLWWYYQLDSANCVKIDKANLPALRSLEVDVFRRYRTRNRNRERSWLWQQPLHAWPLTQDFPEITHLTYRGLNSLTPRWISLVCGSLSTLKFVSFPECRLDLRPELIVLLAACARGGTVESLELHLKPPTGYSVGWTMMKRYLRRHEREREYGVHRQVLNEISALQPFEGINCFPMLALDSLARKFNFTPPGYEKCFDHDGKLLSDDPARWWLEQYMEKVENADPATGYMGFDWKL
ncbi:hypothetical protein BDV96DRAFT_649284 [Lophiotrema nucula]|uniref:Uncharacterized protein n=1 Tax=Lophiotrema nucula TaxID=690887 RepID=A0A6A5Z0C7_9PLEO|nr:hypothetical protein BDV96DRAFT_649284 [Lophiotrema nucula]